MVPHDFNHDFNCAQPSNGMTRTKHHVVDADRNSSGMRVRVRVSNSSTFKTKRSTKMKLTSKQRVASRVYNLTLDVAGLRQELQQLELHRSLLETRAQYTQPAPKKSTSSTAYETSVNYWQVFERGYQAADTAQSEFLAAVADDALQLGVTGLHGRDQLLEQWRLYTEYFAIQRYEMHSMRVVATDDTTQLPRITRGDGVFYGSFTRHALEMVFPAVLQDHELTQQLLDREMVTPVAFVLHFNPDGRWIRHDTEVDLCAAVAQVLGLVKAAAVMVHAHVTDEGFVGLEPLHGSQKVSDHTSTSRASAKRQRCTCRDEVALEREEWGQCGACRTSRLRGAVRNTSGDDGRRHALAFVLS